LIDTTTENPVRLADAAELVGKHSKTVYAWTTRGCRGAVLETIQVGGTRCTSREALQRFFEHLTVRGHVAAPQAPRGEQHATKAGEELARYGI